MNRNRTSVAEYGKAARQKIEHENAKSIDSSDLIDEFAACKARKTRFWDSIEILKWEWLS